MKRFLFLIALFCPLLLMAQFSITGQVLRQSDRQPVDMVAVRLFSYSGADSSMVQGVQTDAEGRYVLPRVARGNYRIHFSSIEYQTRILELQVPGKDGGEVVVMRPVLLSENVHALAAVDIKGQAAEMTVKGDTIEYNTAAYKVQEGAMVEELLKKMNGVTVDREGNVTVNGEAIKAVRIDGKKFFGNDVQSATKNIPADMIDKIQVVDEKSDLARLTGFEDDNTERIINLSLKQNRKRGVFGNFTGGLGADLVTESGRWCDYANPAFGATAAQRAQHFFQDDFRYNASLFTNILLGESQTTILGGANNTNEIRSGRGRGSFGQNNQGITWAENVGVNTNIDLTKRLHNPRPQASLAVGGDAQVLHSINDSRSLTSRESYSQSLTFLNTDSASRQSQSLSTSLRLEVEYSLDSSNTFLFKPNLSYTRDTAYSFSDYCYHREQEVVNSGYQTRLSLSNQLDASLQSIYTHRFSHPGRSLTVNLDFSLADNNGHASTQAFDRLASQLSVDQNTRSISDSYKYSARVSYIEPLYGRNHLLELAAGFSGNHRSSTKQQFVGQNQLLLDSAYSSTFSHQFFSETVEATYRFLNQYCDLSAGLRLYPSQSMSNTTYLIDNQEAVRHRLSVVNYAPSLNFKYKFGKREFARIRYQGKTSQPSISQLEPVKNNSDATATTVGNLALNPAFSHNLNFMYSRFDEKTFASVMCGLRGSLTKDALVSNTIYDQAGHRYQQTVNATNLPWNLGADLMFNVPFLQRKLQLHSRSAVSFRRQIAYLSRERDTQEIAMSLTSNMLPLGEVSLTGNLGVQQNLSLRFVHDIVDLGLNGDFSYSRTQNSLIMSSTSHVFQWTIRGDVQFHLPRGWELAADCGYTDRYGYQLSDVSEILLNASITKSWKNASLKLSANDLLNSRKNIVQVVGDNYVQYQKFNSLPTYAMVTFTYKLNRMGNLKASGRAGFMQDMIEKGGKQGMPPAGVPMGPPPGM